MRIYFEFMQGNVSFLLVDVVNLQFISLLLKEKKKILAMSFYKVTAELTLLGRSNTSQVFKWFWIKPNTLIR